jgi:hypothetical protein
MSFELAQHWNMDAVQAVSLVGSPAGLSNRDDETATAVAAELHTRALHEDAALTQDVFGAADQIGASHRERRMKTLTSLAAKIRRRPELGIYGSAASISDALAYYVVFDTAVFESRFRAMLMALERQGHRAVRERSYWHVASRNKGTHVALMSRNGMPFEIQFHTRASLNAKRLSDVLFAMQRDTTETEERRLWAEEQNLMVMGHVALPVDVHVIGVPSSNARRV